MMREDLVAILTDQQRAASLCLEEPDDHFLLLKQANRISAVFSQIGATKNSIRAEARQVGGGSYPKSYVGGNQMR